MVSGNFAGDLNDDIAVIYDYSTYADVLVFESTGNLFGDGWVTVHDGKGSYLAPNMQYSVFGGNVTGGGYDEIVSLYKQTSRESSIYKFEANSSGTFYLYNNLWNSQIYELSDDTASTSTRVASETIGDDVYTYTYDKLGNITEIKKNGGYYKSFQYDALGQLIRSDDVRSWTSFIYTYDAGGNITRKKAYDYCYPGTPVNTNHHNSANQSIFSYTYSTGGWKDLLLETDEFDFDYDEIGNPTEWVNRDMTWADGKLLVGIDPTDPIYAISYEYNSSGIRTKKTADGVTHEYFLDGSKIVREVRSDGITLDFYYDESGNVFAFDYKSGNNNSIRYYYVRNILGEILGIIDTDGTYVVRYSYDAWGYPVDIVDGSWYDVSLNLSHLANVNPFRYKGYYFDDETYYYYLNSRYYDPFMARFIGPDSFVSTGTGFLGYNMFAYCNNCPVMLKDSSGLRPAYQVEELDPYYYLDTIPREVKKLIDATSFVKLINGCGPIEFDVERKRNEAFSFLNSKIISIGNIRYYQFDSVDKIASDYFDKNLKASSFSKEIDKIIFSFETIDFSLSFAGKNIPYFTTIDYLYSFYTFVKNMTDDNRELYFVYAGYKRKGLIEIECWSNEYSIMPQLVKKYIPY